MPTPPFSQDRRDWLTEISSLFAKKSKDVAVTTPKTGLNVAFPKACDSVTTISTCNSRDNGSSNDQAVGNRPGRLG
jgi:hypothetical protein